MIKLFMDEFRRDTFSHAGDSGLNYTVCTKGLHHILLDNVEVNIFMVVLCFFWTVNFRSE